MKTRKKKRASPLEATASVIEVYRAAQRLRADAFAAKAFAWIDAQFPIDRAVMVTSLRGATWVDAHFHRVPDPRALMESHDRVRHLDAMSAEMLANPNRVHRSSFESTYVSGPHYALFREHLKKYDGRWILSIAIPNEREETLSVLMVLRGWKRGRPDFDENEHDVFAAIAPHIVEAFAVNRTTFLGTAAIPGSPPGHAPPVASIDDNGRFIGTMPAFVRLFWPDEPPGTAYLPPDVLTRLRRGLPWPMPNGDHTLHAYREQTGGFLLRLRSKSPADHLSARERQIAGLFARGASYKAIAGELALSPATVRNHLQNLYAKLGVTQRDELHALLAKP